MINVTSAILCGGSVTRLWPLSRTRLPKQVHSLTGVDILFQQIAQRLSNMSNADFQVASQLIITGEEQRFLNRSAKVF